MPYRIIHEVNSPTKSKRSPRRRRTHEPVYYIEETHDPRRKRDDFSHRGEYLTEVGKPFYIEEEYIADPYIKYAYSDNEVYALDDYGDNVTYFASSWKHSDRRCNRKTKERNYYRDNQAKCKLNEYVMYHDYEREHQPKHYLKHRPSSRRHVSSHVLSGKYAIKEDRNTNIVHSRTYPSSNWNLPAIPTEAVATHHFVSETAMTSFPHVKIYDEDHFDSGAASVCVIKQSPTPREKTKQEFVQITVNRNQSVDSKTGVVEEFSTQQQKSRSFPTVENLPVHDDTTNIDTLTLMENTVAGKCLEYAKETVSDGGTTITKEYEKSITLPNKTENSKLLYETSTSALKSTNLNGEDSTLTQEKESYYENETSTVSDSMMAISEGPSGQLKGPIKSAKLLPLVLEEHEETETNVKTSVGSVTKKQLQDENNVSISKVHRTGVNDETDDWEKADEEAALTAYLGKRRHTLKDWMGDATAVRGRQEKERRRSMPASDSTEKGKPKSSALGKYKRVFNNNQTKPNKNDNATSNEIKRDDSYQSKDEDDDVFFTEDISKCRPQNNNVSSRGDESLKNEQSNSAGGIEPVYAALQGRNMKEKRGSRAVSFEDKTPDKPLKETLEGGKNDDGKKDETDGKWHPGKYLNKVIEKAEECPWGLWLSGKRKETWNELRDRVFKRTIYPTPTYTNVEITCCTDVNLDKLEQVKNCQYCYVSRSFENMDEKPTDIDVATTNLKDIPKGGVYVKIYCKDCDAYEDLSCCPENNYHPSESKSDEDKIL